MNKLSLTCCLSSRHLMMWMALALCLFLPVKSFGTNDPDAAYRLRLMTYNIHHGEGLDGKINLDRIVAAIRKNDVDVVALQEVDSVTFRSMKCDQLAELASDALLHPTYASTIDFGGGKYGIGLLSRERPLRVKRIPLPGKEERRILLVVEFSHYIVACTHLSLDSTERMASLPIIRRAAAEARKPFLLAGDWNDTPKSSFVKELSKSFWIFSNTSRPTYPANKPKDCIDYLAAYNGNSKNKVIRLSTSVIAETVTSDHRPVVGEVRFRVPAEQLMTSAPYLQDAEPDGMTVMFQTNVVCHCWVEYGTDVNHLQKARTLIDGQEVCYDIENKIRLSNLTPGTRYYYRVRAVDLMLKHSYENYFGDTLTTKIYSFRTPSAQDRNFTALVFNDLHQFQETYDSLRLAVKSVPYDFVIFNGDCMPEPSDRADAISMIHALADPIDGAEHPIVFIRGNHEIRNFYSAGMHRLIGYKNDKTYGGFNWGDTRFVVMDCGEDKEDSSPVYGGLNDFTQLRTDQLNYLKTELRSPLFRKAKRRVLIGHIPVFGFNDRYHPCTEMWGPVLAKAPFDVAIFAHTHEYKFYPTGVDGARFPVEVGGGPESKEATVSVITKAGDKMNLKVVTIRKGTILDKDL